MDPFQTLPVPILEQILQLLADLPTLSCLHNASPTVASLLHRERVASGVVEAIISDSPPQIQFLIRTIARLRWASSTGSRDAANETTLPSSWDTFTGSLSRIGPGGRITPAGHGDVHLSKVFPPLILCQILGLSVRVRQMAHACLHDLIARCLSLEPMHLKNPRFRYKYRPKFEQRQPRPEGLPYKPVDAGPPSWAEEQRVMRAVWRIVLFFELYDAVIARHLLDWGEEDTRHLQGLGAEEFWEEILVGGESIELTTVLEWVFPASSRLRNESLLPWKESSAAPGRKWLYCCQESSPVTEGGWKDASFALDAPGCAFGRQAIPNLPFSPLRHVDFEVFRPYGFAIWDLKRMVALGFLESFTRDDRVRNALLSESNLFFTWESILTKDQLEGLEKKQKELWDVC